MNVEFWRPLAERIRETWKTGWDARASAISLDCQARNMFNSSSRFNRLANAASESFREACDFAETQLGPLLDAIIDAAYLAEPGEVGPHLLLAARDQALSAARATITSARAAGLNNALMIEGPANAAVAEIRRLNEARGRALSQRVELKLEMLRQQPAIAGSTHASKFTLDTNSLIYLFDNSATPPAGSREALQDLLRRSLEGELSISATTRARADLLQDPNTARRDGMLQILESLPIVPSIAGWNESTWNSDTWGNQQTMELFREIEAIVFPSLSTSDRHYANKRQDIGHLAGHKLDARDVFVTDDVGILRKAKALERGPGIIVRSPIECSQYLSDAESAARASSLGSTTTDTRFTSRTFRGRAQFDYSNNDGLFTIGTGAHLFETKWTKASDQRIYVYSDPPSIAAVAKATGHRDIDTIANAATFDATSRTRTIGLGEIAIWRNTNGFYAATKVISIADDTRNGATADDVIFDYVILVSGSDFREN